MEKAKRARKAETPKQPSLRLRLRAPYFYPDQRLNLSKPREGPRKIGQGFKPDSGNPTVRHYRGASRNVSHGEIVTPSAIERAGTETPHLQRSALDFYPDSPSDMARDVLK